jgi:hypothetical protein
MVQQDSIARLSGTYRTVGTHRGQTGRRHPPCSSEGVTGAIAAASRWQAAVRTGATPSLGCARPHLPAAHRFTGVSGRGLDARFFPIARANWCTKLRLSG